MFFETNSKNESSHTMSFKACVCVIPHKKKNSCCAWALCRMWRRLNWLQMRTMCNLHNVLTYQLPYEQLNELSSTPTFRLIIQSISKETSHLS